MKYIIKNKINNTYFNKKYSYGFHFVLDYENAYRFRNKDKAIDMINQMDKLKQYMNFEIVEVNK